MPIKRIKLWIKIYLGNHCLLEVWKGVTNGKPLPFWTEAAEDLATILDILGVYAILFSDSRPLDDLCGFLTSSSTILL
jgi:hypothetical protein